MPDERDDDTEAIARVFAMEAEGRRSRRRRRWAAPAPKRPHTRWPGTVRTVVGAGAATKTATGSEPPPLDATNEVPELTLNDFLEGLPAQQRVERVEPEDYYDS